MGAIYFRPFRFIRGLSADLPSKQKKNSRQFDWGRQILASFKRKTLFEEAHKSRNWLLNSSIGMIIHRKWH